MIFFHKKKKYVVIVETMDNKISLYRGLPGNREFSGIQGLPYFVFNPLRNLLLTKEDIDHSSPAKDMMTESGLGMADPTASGGTGGTGANGLSGSGENRIDLKRDDMPIEYGGTDKPDMDIRTIPKKDLVNILIEEESGPTGTFTTGANGLPGSIDFKKDVMPYEDGDPNTPSGPESGDTDTFPTGEDLPTKNKMEQL
jgi:hypothetical protein